MPFCFAYGSNMDKNQMLERCPESKAIGKGVLHDYILGFTRFSKNRNSAVADILVSPGNQVWGVVYEVSGSDIEKLDIIEGHPHAYRRIQERISLYIHPDLEKVLEWLEEGRYDLKIENYINDPNNYRQIECFTYEVVRKDLQVGYPTIEYMDYLMTGAVEFNFPEVYIGILLKFFEKEREKKNGKAIELFIRLMDIIKSNKFTEVVKDTEEWGGADLVITGNKKRRESLAKNHPDDIVVFTPWWKELSWLVQAIYRDENIKWKIDDLNKYYFLAEIGKAAIEYQGKQGNDDNTHIGICDALLTKAYTLFT